MNAASTIRRNKRILVGVTGGVVAYNSLDLVRRLSDKGVLHLNSLAKCLICAFCLAIANSAAGQSTIEQLNDAIAKGDITVEAITGTGGSSGMVINGYLVNESPIEKNIDVHLGLPIYFVNRGRGQNMVATQVYGRDRSYFRIGNQNYIQVARNSRTPISFVAYCVDFDKDNPTSEDMLSAGDMPSEIESLVQRIAEIEHENSDLDLTISAQLALWVFQGTSLDEIRQRFDFSETDLAWMYKILQ